MVCGDMNIAPTDEDVFDPAAYVGHTHVTAPERAALAALEAVGLHDVVRERWPGGRVFTYRDYRAGMFHQDLGVRIDLVLGGRPSWRAYAPRGSTARRARAAGQATTPRSSSISTTRPMATLARSSRRPRRRPRGAGPSSSPNPPKRRRAAGRPVSPGASKYSICPMTS